MICRNLPFYEFRPGIFEVDEFDCVSCFVVVGEKSALLLDVRFSAGNGRRSQKNGNHGLFAGIPACPFCKKEKII